MPLYRSQTLSPDKLLVMAANLLHKSFHDASRMMAKRRFQLLESGKDVFLVNVRMEDNSELQINLRLDRSELRGKLNFSTFRQLIARLLHGFMQKMQAKESLNPFTDEDGKRWSYMIPAIMKTGQQFDMMILGADVRVPGVLTFELMFIDPEQFKRADASA
jgi:hypothetical protein